MVLESTIICCDNSEYQRNGDYIPTRLSAQIEAINLISMSKIRANPENNVALITIANTVEVLSTLTNDIGKISIKMGKVKPNGDINLLTGLRIAHMVLKHRQEKHHRMRIVVFVGSPLKNNIEVDLVNLAKKLKKENVQVDVVSFGGYPENDELLRKFLDTVNGKEGTSSNMVAVPPRTEITDLLLNSPIVLGEDGMDALALRSAYEYGVDTNEDPDLALALRISMEEERQRQEAERLRQEAEGGRDNTNEAVTIKNEQNRSPTNDTNNRPIVYDFENMSEDQQIAYALAMSMQQDQNFAETQRIEESAPNLANNPESEASNQSDSCCCSSSCKCKDKKKKK